MNKEERLLQGYKALQRIIKEYELILLFHDRDEGTLKQAYVRGPNGLAIQLDTMEKKQ